jgi:hypothetical protein
VTIVLVMWGGHTAYLRDPRRSGAFLRGIECNEHGVAVREGCTDDAELMIRVDRITLREVLQ